MLQISIKNKIFKILLRKEAFLITFSSSVSLFHLIFSDLMKKSKRILVLKKCLYTDLEKSFTPLEICKYF